jgi:hypothetical protein
VPPAPEMSLMALSVPGLSAYAYQEASWLVLAYTALQPLAPLCKKAAFEFDASRVAYRRLAGNSSRQRPAAIVTIEPASREARTPQPPSHVG